MDEVFVIDWGCVDCGVHVRTIKEYAYAVTREVWLASGLSRTGGFLCVVCLERRLGRQLVNDDFARDDSVNRRTDHQSLRLQRRIQPLSWIHLVMCLLCRRRVWQRPEIWTGYCHACSGCMTP